MTSSRFITAGCSTCGAKVETYANLDERYMLVLVHLPDGSHQVSLLKVPEK